MNSEKAPPPSWPESGKIEFINMSLSYSLTDPPVLKDLTFVIEAKEKASSKKMSSVESPPRKSQSDDQHEVYFYFFCVVRSASAGGPEPGRAR
jgi:hypothetical protein